MVSKLKNQINTTLNGKNKTDYNNRTQERFNSYCTIVAQAQWEKVRRNSETSNSCSKGTKILAIGTNYSTNRELYLSYWGATVKCRPNFTLVNKTVGVYREPYINISMFIAIRLQNYSGQNCFLKFLMAQKLSIHWLPSIFLGCLHKLKIDQ